MKNTNYCTDLKNMNTGAGQYGPSLRSCVTYIHSHLNLASTSMPNQMSTTAATTNEARLIFEIRCIMYLQVTHSDAAYCHKSGS